jgi:hypothetical protein
MFDFAKRPFYDDRFYSFRGSALSQPPQAPLESIPDLAGPMQLQRTGGGRSNPTYFVTFEARRLCCANDLSRRPNPTGITSTSATDWVIGGTLPSGDRDGKVWALMSLMAGVLALFSATAVTGIEARVPYRRDTPSRQRSRSTVPPLPKPRRAGGSAVRLSDTVARYRRWSSAP